MQLILKTVSQTKLNFNLQIDWKE